MSCNWDSKPQSTYLGGQIINPKGKHVVISNNHRKNDTITLDDNGRFSFECESLVEDIYTFSHGEIQYMIIEPGDSILFRVNAMVFDESLAFSGKGSEKNNYLINLFLENENDNELLHSQYKLTTEQFLERIDSDREIDNTSLKGFIENENPGKLFNRIAQSTLDYNYYYKKEMFAAHKLGANDESIEDIPSSFFEHRKNINPNDALLSNYYAYYRLLNIYFDNLAYEQYKDTIPYNRKSFLHNKEKLKLIDFSIKHKDLHNNLLRTNVRSFLINANDSAEEGQMLSLFESIDSNKKHLAEMKQFLKKTAKTNAGKRTPNLMLVNTNNETLKLSDVAKNKSVLFFWTTGAVSHFKEIHTHVLELKSKYPEYTFIGINTDTNFKSWKKTVQNFGYNSATEFQFENNDKAREELYINSANKTMIIDKDLTILEGNTNLFNQEFESLLLGHLN